LEVSFATRWRRGKTFDLIGAYIDSRVECISDRGVRHQNLQLAPVFT
jgi:hypothetical protein